MESSTTGVTSNEKSINETLNTEPISTTDAQADGNEPEYLEPWKLFPIAIALGLAIVIIGLASVFVAI